MASKITMLTSENFEKKTKKGKWAIDFWAEWCGPCRMMAPHFEEAAKEMKGKVQFGKLDVDANSEIAQKFNVLSIPTMILFKDGKEAGRTIGAISKEDILESVKSNLK